MSISSKENATRDQLEALYAQYNRAEYVSPDPLETVYRYDSREDREIVGLIAAGLAYGRVAQILKSIDIVLKVMGESPRDFVTHVTRAQLCSYYAGFKHRWTTSEELVDFLEGIGAAVNRRGSLEQCFVAHHDPDAPTTLDGLKGFITEVGPTSSLLSDPSKTSACKRLHLYMRWMVRNDEVDPGCWKAVAPSQLIVPLDTHLFAIGKAFGFTKRKQPNLSAALDLTESFRAMTPEDPLRYDFVLTRFGIRSELDRDALIAEHTAVAKPKRKRKQRRS